MRTAAALPTGYLRHHLPVVDSTSSEARRQAEAGADTGLVVTAESQTGGRGRHGRDWQSPAGNLYCSILMRPDMEVAEAPLTGFAVSLAVATVLADLAGDRAQVRCKWPNDVLAGDRKIAGILVESASGPGGALDWLIVGIGINVASHPDIAGKPATSLLSLGAATSLDDLLGRIVAAADRTIGEWRREGFEPVRTRWLSRAWRLGEQVDLVAGKEHIVGAFRGLDENGGIVLEMPGGERRNLGHGELMAQG